MTTDRKAGTLELNQIVKHYRDIIAVDEISLATRPGEFLTLLGPSGSGKTTTLGIVAGFVEATAGEVWLDGDDLRGVRPHRRDIGVVFQNYALFPHMSAAQNIGFPLSMRGVGRAEAERRVREVLELVQLQGLGERNPRELSGGQQQRVAFARAVVFEPRLLLMDEPLGALDKKLREALQIEVMRISRQLGVTVVYVTHDQEEALVMSDRIAIYNQGKVEQIGAAEDLYESPTSLFVAQFVGESNILRGRLTHSGNRLDCGTVEVAVDPSGNVRTGAAALVLRPERLRLQSSGAVADGRPSNNVVGRVVEAIYLGNARRYVVELAGGPRVQVRTQVGLDDPALPAGAEAVVSWAVSDGILLPDPGCTPPVPGTELTEAPDVATAGRN